MHLKEIILDRAVYYRNIWKGCLQELPHPLHCCYRRMLLGLSTLLATLQPQSLCLSHPGTLLCWALHQVRSFSALLPLSHRGSFAWAMCIFWIEHKHPSVVHVQHLCACITAFLLVSSFHTQMECLIRIFITLSVQRRPHQTRRLWPCCWHTSFQHPHRHHQRSPPRPHPLQTPECICRTPHSLLQPLMTRWPPRLTSPHCAVS